MNLPPPPDTLERRYIGTRVGFCLVAVVVYFGTMFVLANEPSLVQPEVWEVCKWVIGTLAAAIGGDTVRPSGKATGSFGVSSSAKVEAG